MRKRITANGAACALVLLAMLAVQMLMHLNADSLLLDDWVFFTALDGGQGPLAYLAGRWQTWSSRLLIEGVLLLTTRSIWAWRVLDALAMALLAWALCRLADGRTRPGLLSVSCLLVTGIPFAILRSTGWQATSVNYYWPLSCAAAALIPVGDALRGQKTGQALSAAAVACAVFAANQEQFAAALLGAHIVCVPAMRAQKRRVAPAVWMVAGVAALELALHLCCPGNAARSAASIALVNLRDYGQFTLVDKLSIGLTSTTALLLFTPNPMLIACGACVAGAMLARRRGPGAQALVVGVALAHALFAFAGEAVLTRLPAVANYRSYVLQLGPGRYLSPGQMGMMLAVVLLLGLMAVALYLCIGHRGLSAAAVLAYGVGFAARLALAFSPTVVESGERTMLPLYGAMMLCALLCVKDCRDEGGRRWPLLLALGVCALIAGMNVAGSFALAG